MSAENNVKVGCGIGGIIGGAIGLFGGMGGGIYASIIVGKQIVSAFPASAHVGATVLAVITGMSITGLAATVGALLFCCFCGCLGGTCFSCCNQNDNESQHTASYN